ncbi:MAG TPA: Gfo/Idh/MocA family oxidoreductase [Candidatus Paceibacterota bacterium]|nr:Gfo/Idh/MocA family oxidoreductase [Verrucomicrobiota bacterium]HRY51294.1 Gfo/Idh/MocA family oxidoreductase [Candidatus Paceibacterota bacterium]HSA03368.1 Gfo/Idh/MocA family oxidoreductase [Candidatus Paceibacterota bacterium]
MNDTSSISGASSRRQFLKTSSAAVIGGAIVGNLEMGGTAFAANSDTLRVGLVGCGGRGSGAAVDALSADKNAILTAVGDALEDHAKSGLKNLQNNKEVGDRVKVSPDHCFSGLDAFQKVIDSGVDVVLLASPPGFRPQHLKAAVAAGKHVFCEKPMATDVPGARSVQESVAAARQKKTALVAGFCWRYELARREFYRRIHDGAIGDIRAIYATYLTGPVKPMPPASERPSGMSDVEWQIRNWYNFTWLSGDGLVEQACHSIDKIAWGMNGVMPIKIVGNGGRQTPNHEGNIFDHIDVFYEYPNGVRAFMAQRQIANCYGDNSDYLMGAKGTGTIKGWSAPEITGPQAWKYQGRTTNMYQQEHNELFASIRKGEPINDGDWMVQSTLMAIGGRMSAYTGKEITWEELLNSQDRLVPESMDWNMKLPIRPMAMPGKTPFA